MMTDKDVERLQDTLRLTSIKLSRALNETDEMRVEINDLLAGQRELLRDLKEIRKERDDAQIALALVRAAFLKMDEAGLL
jgi:hypothetical protein